MRGLGSIQVHSSPFAVERKEQQVRFPRSKKRRIRKKWSKDRRYWRVEIIPCMYMINDSVLVVHPSLMDTLRGEDAN